MNYVRMAIRIVIVLVVVGVAAAGCDFVNFVGRADKAVTPSQPDHAEGVTALTGASNARIVVGVQLATSLQLPLLISGVHVDTSTADIAKIANVPETEIQCCVTLGRAAATTEGNGAEVAEWARRHRLKRIVVVTSEYHMDRALLELRRAMPEGEFIPYAVASSTARPRDWYHDLPTARRLFEEWAKYRVSSLRGAPPAPGGSTG
jgi:uncharacterized SAM-binding protein YcdF (DUF218 family)